jgi:transcriptional regulator with XRE-family HTH domain
MDENPDQREGRVVGRVPADTFSHRLLLARAEMHLTIEQAAAKCGLLSQSWGQWERGSTPRDRVDVVEAVSEGLGIDRDWLLYGGPLAKPERVRKIRVAYARRSVRPGARRPRRIGRTRTSVAA